MLQQSIGSYRQFQKSELRLAAILYFVFEIYSVSKAAAILHFVFEIYSVNKAGCHVESFTCDKYPKQIRH